MRKLLNKPWFAVVMAVAAIALVANALLPKSDNAVSGGVSAETGVVSEVEGVAETAERLPTEAILKALPISTVVRDPFALRPVKTEAVEKKIEPDVVESLHLSAIWTQAGQTLVLLNDRICQGGDNIGRFKIESASQDGVWITHWKGRDLLLVGGNLTLSTPASRALSTANSL